MTDATVGLDLHSHLEGRVRPGTAAELARRLGAPEPPRGWAAALRLEQPGDLTAYLACVAASYPLLRDPEAVRRVAYEAVLDAAADGQAHLELRFGPATHVTDEHGLEEVVRAAATGAREGAAATGMPAGIVIAALRNHDAATNEAVARAAAVAAGEGVTGFDLAGDESRWPAHAPFARSFRIAAAAGLGLTCHAAEAAGPGAVADAVRELGVRRIGHGAHLAEDPRAMALAADEGLVVEICPSSNVWTGAIARVEDHPARTFLGAGIRLVLGDDNPVQTGSPLSAERRILRERLGFTAEELARLDTDALEAAFLTPSERHAAASLLAGRAPSR
ncbi:adenosine deaminase [Amnibacterium kyonggiense]|uniref:adenosine deaminase n=1 Tax=Amnibacterium kyonggiense TaxID=595671 RepID=A0A4R7FI33_9MICO|nr:adenosine deaminase [Amnibacterium kyonggiense]TDS76164.1 adenosine deaminase [Amnibacterium kyonggiense]